ncbi:DinB family protein [Paenibacillus sp. NPDC058071]|uniref:DinB family protein n=1 Tax=Paenibacillus sp. NPDC058071 TaxID=3346326 RepID=UPI0036DA2BAB
MTNMNEFISGWMSHRNTLHQMLEEVTTEQLAFKPWEKGMSVSELILHITGSMSMFALTVKNSEHTQPGAPKPFATADEFRANVTAVTEQTVEMLKSLAPEQLDKLIAFFGNTLPGSALLQNAKDHEIHHKGQLFTYLRLAGIEKLPFFVSRG